jgi:hypothetical protein
MTTEQELIWKYLKDNALGHANAVHYPPIAEVIGVECIGSNCQNVRSIIKEMVEVHGLPIGTSKKGVFVNVSEKDIEIAVNWVERPNRGDNIRNNGIYTEE